MSVTVEATGICDVCGKMVKESMASNRVAYECPGEKEGWIRVRGLRDLDLCPGCAGTPYITLLGLQRKLDAAECKEVQAELMPPAE